MKKILTLVMALLFTTVLLAGCTSKSSKTPTPAAGDKTQGETKKDVKVGFIYVGPPGDGGFTYSHDQGRKYLVEKLGVQTITKENVKEDKAEVKKVIDDMVKQGCNVVIGTSFGFMDGMVEGAKAYPDVKFLHCSGSASSGNMLNYFGRIEEPRYLSGIVAGLKTKTNKIGYVAAYEIPECVRGIDAFTLGVRSVNKDAKVIVNWTHTWYDPATEKEAAKALLAKGADVITQHQDTPSAQQAAEEKGVWSIGYNSDMKDKAPKAYMTAPIWNWGPYYVKQVQAVQNGTWKSENYWGGMKDGIVDLAPLTENAPADAKDKVEKAKQAIISGTLNVFAGPIKDQTGKVRIAEGKTMTDEEQLNLDWFVEGVEGQIAK